jgi:hypothetical protein
MGGNQFIAPVNSYAHCACAYALLLLPERYWGNKSVAPKIVPVHKNDAYNE